MELNNQEYFIVFDTNILFQTYEKKADFTSFSFNATFNNVIDMINQLDIYEKVTIAIPEVTWNEMTKQIIEAHDKKLVEFKSYIQKWIFPEYSIAEVIIDNYRAFIMDKIDSYQAEIQSGINNIITLPIPSNDRFKGIIQRAFDKFPPFGGKEKNSDKGFKDVLLWESILEFTLSHKEAKIIFYTKDNGFKDILIEEFNKLYPQAFIAICSIEHEIKELLENWAREIDIYMYQPIESYNETRDIIEWLESSDFEIQMIERDYGLIEKSRLISSTYLKLLSYDNISVVAESENIIKYSIDTTLEIGYTFKGGGAINENIDVTILVRYNVDKLYSVEDVYRLNASNTKESERED